MRNRSLLAPAILAVASLLVAACGGGSSGPALTGAAAEGRRIARSAGCAACHGADGQGGVGPAWEDLAGSEVELDDGTIVLADDEYLRRAITDPGAEVVADTSVSMPSNDLDPDQVEAIIAFITALSEDEA